MENSKHRIVGRQHFRTEPLDAPLFGDFCDIVQQKSADALSLPFILHKEGNFGGLCLRIEKILRYSDDFLARNAGHHSYNGDIIAVINIGDPLNVTMWERHGSGHIAGSDGFITQ